MPPTLMSQQTASDDVREIADAAAARWRAVDAVLAPIIGSRGVAALYRRSLHLARANHPCLVGLHDDPPPSAAIASLREALGRQTSRDAAAAQAALLQIFCDAMTRLIGPALTGRLLVFTTAGETPVNIDPVPPLPDGEGAKDAEQAAT